MRDTIISGPQELPREKRPSMALGEMSDTYQLEASSWLFQQLQPYVRDRPASYIQIAFVMLRYFSDTRRVAAFSFSQLAEGARVSKKTAIKAIGMLVADGHVRIVTQGSAGRGCRNVYRLVLRPEFRRPRVPT